MMEITIETQSIKTMLDMDIDFLISHLMIERERRNAWLPRKE